MNRKMVSKALSGISMDYIAQCEAYTPKLQELPSGKAQKTGRFEQTPKGISRKILALVLAACLILGLSITAYATGIVQSLIAKWAQGFILETPTDELRESRPDYAEWLDQQWETRAALEEIAGKAQQVNEEKNPEGLADASITLLEYCYDGKTFTMACRFDAPQRPVTFDVDPNDPQFADLQALQDGYWVPAEDWHSYIALREEDRQLILQKLERDGSVGFTTYEFFVSDHVLVNGEDPGFSHSDPNDNDGIFYVDPYYTSVFGSELPESCQNLPELEVTFTVRCCLTHYWLDGDTFRWANGARIDYPVSFTLENVNNELP